MAEFCLECWNRINKRNYTECDYLLSEDLDLCEGCGQYKQVIIREKTFLESLAYELHRKFNKNK